MAILGRKKGENEKGIPNLPELPSLSDPSGEEADSPEKDDYSYSMPPLNKDLKELPSFPDSKFGASLSQEAVKSAVDPKSRKKTAEFNEPEFTLPKSIQKPVSLNFPKAQNKPLTAPVYQEMIQPAYSQSIPIEHPFQQEIRQFTPPSVLPAAQEKSISEPVYIRLDKFKFALESFQVIKEKINEVEKYLQEIKGQKKREDEELKEWENEIEAIKLRIEGIDNKIFSKV